MLLLGTHKGVRKAFMAGDYAKCDRLGNEFFANNPMGENKLRVKRFIDENIDEVQEFSFDGLDNDNNGIIDDEVSGGDRKSVV